MSTTTSRSTAGRGGRLAARAAELAEAVRPDSARHDRDGTFVAPAIELARDGGLLAAPVPEALGGEGATLREVTLAQAELARGCASAALASSMHLHVTLTAAWRWRHGDTRPEPLLRRIAQERIVVASSGGSDFTRPSGRAERVEGGYRVSARKVFVSLAPVAHVLSAWAPYEDPREGTVVLGFGIPMDAPGVAVVDTWDAVGMRGTGSHDVVLDGVLVTDDEVTATRAWGRLDPLFSVTLTHAMTVVSGVYWGLARRARDDAVAVLAGSGRAEDPVVLRQVGEMEHLVRTSGWALSGLLDALGDDPRDTLAAVSDVFHAKRSVALAARRVTELAMDAVGGRSFFRSAPFEQAWRDARAAPYHPLTPEATLLHAGRLALGLPADEV
jgi:alkylation response protein AidB-like acyl-CoA dehydrogenase